MGLLVIAPFALGFGAAVLQVFPFAGTRHQAYLLPFFAAGVAAAFTRLPRGLAVPVLLLAALIAPRWAARIPPDNSPFIQPTGDMTAAIRYISKMVPSGTPLFVDQETGQELRYYLARNEADPDISNSKTAIERQLGHWRVVEPKTPVWAFSPDETLDRVTELAEAVSVPPNDPVWVVSVSWLESPLASRLPPGTNRDVKEFGRISVIKLKR